VLSFAVVTEAIVRLCNCEENWEILDVADDNLAVREIMMGEKKECFEEIIENLNVARKR
jgi:hypothetical protein